MFRLGSVFSQPLYTAMYIEKLSQISESPEMGNTEGNAHFI